MSKLAEQLAAAPPSAVRTKRGPTATCVGVYQPDLEDAQAIQEFRSRPTETWKTAQARWDQLLGITKPILNDKFRYHWNRRCDCWPVEQRLS